MRSRPVLIVLVAVLLAACGSANPSPSLGPTLRPITPVPSVQSTASAATPTATSTASAGGPTALPPSPSASVPAPSAPSESALTPSSSAVPSGASDPNRDLYLTIEREVEALRGLQPKRAVEPVILDEAGLRAELLAHADEDMPPAEIARQDRLLKALGVLPADADLGAIMNSFLTSQIAGFYRPSDGHLYVVSRSGTIGGAERVTFAHEYTHALQDQNFPLLQQLDATGGPENGDRDLARLALIEGDATLSMTYWAQQHLTPLELLDLLRSSFDPAQQAALAAMPTFLRDQAMFPYESGLQLAMNRQVPGGWKAVDALFAAPPVSSEQVLHPEKLAAHEAPVPVTLPADLATKIGPGWTADPDDTIGEFQLREWLTALGVAEAQAGTAAAGWGGDRVGYVMGPDGRWLLMLVTAWDTPADAAEFQAAADTALATAGHPGVTKTQGGDVVVLIANDASTLDNISPLAMKAGPFR